MAGKQSPRRSGGSYRPPTYSGSSRPGSKTSKRELARAARARTPYAAKDVRRRDKKKALPRQLPKPVVAFLNQSGKLLAALATAIAGFAAFFALPLRFAILTLGLAGVVAAAKTVGRLRLAAIVVVFCALAADGVAWTTWVRQAHAAQQRQLALDRMRLTIVKDINGIRAQRGVAPLTFDPALTAEAQQQAHYNVAENSGEAAVSTDKDAALQRNTNMWESVLGVGHSWADLFAMSLNKKLKNSGLPELFLPFGVIGGRQAEPLYSSDFDEIGVGYAKMTNGEVTVMLDLLGRRQPGHQFGDAVPPNERITVTFTDKTKKVTLVTGVGKP